MNKSIIETTIHVLGLSLISLEQLESKIRTKDGIPVTVLISDLINKLKTIQRGGIELDDV